MPRSKEEGGARNLAKPGERVGKNCPICQEPVLKQEQISSNGKSMGSRLVCSKRGCPWQGRV